MSSKEKEKKKESIVVSISMLLSASFTCIIPLSPQHSYVNMYTAHLVYLYINEYKYLAEMRFVKKQQTNRTTTKKIGKKPKLLAIFSINFGHVFLTLFRFLFRCCTGFRLYSVQTFNFPNSKQTKKRKRV